MSTYIRAKKFGIPIVSVVWIEACKLANGPVDPALYPPTKMEKYEEETPFSLMMVITSVIYVINCEGTVA